MTETVTMYRPVGKNELKLIEESGFTAYPPRLLDQPIFYPVLNEGYAPVLSTYPCISTMCLPANTRVGNQHPPSIQTEHRGHWVPAFAGMHGGMGEWM